MRRKGNGRDRGVRGNGPSDENGVQKEKGNRVWHRMLCKISSWQITDRSVQTSIHAFQAPILFFFFFCSISLSIFSLMYYYLLFSFLAYFFFFFWGGLIDIGHHHAVRLPVGRSSIKLQFPSGCLHSIHLKTVFCWRPALLGKE